MLDFRVFSLAFQQLLCQKKYEHFKLAQWWCGAYSRSALFQVHTTGCWLITLRKKTVRFWWQSLLSQCCSPFYTLIKVTPYDSCQLAWIAQWWCVASGHRNYQGLIPCQAWIFQVLFQPLRFFILYWEDHLHFHKVPTQYKAIYFRANLNLLKTICFEHSYIPFLPRRATKFHTSL